MALRGRRTMLLVAVPCAVVLGLFIYALNDRLVEAWYIHKVETGTAEEVETYGEKLQATATLKTVAALLGLLERNRGRILHEKSPISDVFFRCVETIGPEALAATILKLDGDERGESLERFLASTYAWSIAIQCMKSPDPIVRREAAAGFYSRSSSESTSVLLALLKDPFEDVRASAACALARWFPRNLDVRRELRIALRQGDLKLRRTASS